MPQQRYSTDFLSCQEYLGVIGNIDMSYRFSSSLISLNGPLKWDVLAHAKRLLGSILSYIRHPFFKSTRPQVFLILCYVLIKMKNM